ncbi:MAG: dephospho-CoA kinase [Bacteroidota bacterium]|nr:dephospho-CoA kinase [Bacteroidota bacterium]
MKRIGIGGGIGSGKTGIAKAFETFDIPVYYADNEAKKIMETKHIRNRITRAFDASLFIDGKLNKTRMSKLIFNDDRSRQQINDIVHPAVYKDFNRWAKQQNKDIVMIEAAILFETGLHKQLDATILVLADEQERIQRIEKRDHRGRASVMERIKSQQNPDNFINLATFLIYNNDTDEVLPQILRIHKTLTNNG